jgi:hypothetical protein
MSRPWTTGLARVAGPQLSSRSIPSQVLPFSKLLLDQTGKQLGTNRYVHSEREVTSGCADQGSLCRSSAPAAAAGKGGLARAARLDFVPFFFSH